MRRVAGAECNPRQPRQVRPVGDVIADEDEVFGDDVNIAVRLETVAAPGGMAVSSKAYHEAGKHLGVNLVDAGSHRFKNIDEPVGVWSWEPGGLDDRARETRSATNLPAQHRTAIVGVLPFTNLSGGADERLTREWDRADPHSFAPKF